MSNLKTRLGLSLSVCYLLSHLLSASPSLTTIQDVLYKADGSRFNGILTITWTSFRAADSSNIATQSVTAHVTNGYLRVLLAPTTNAVSPAVYNVVYNSDGVIQFSESWVVPPSTSPLRVADVRSSSAAGAAVALSQIQVTDVAGLRTELNIRPTIGSGYSTSRAAIIDSSGGLSSASGNLSDCVHVDGSSGVCGAAGISSSPGFIDGENPSGLVDGVNTAFQLANAPSPASSLALYRNGLSLQRTDDFTLSGVTITFVPGNAPQPGDVLQAFYRTGSPGAASTGGSSTPACTLYTLANNGPNWTVATNGGTPTAGPAIASTNTQDVPLFGLPARGTVMGIREKTTTAWSGAGFSLFTLSLGDSVGGPSFYTAPGFDLTAAAADNNFRGTPLFLEASNAGSNVTAHIAANTALNSAAIIGAVDIDVCWVVLP